MLLRKYYPVPSQRLRYDDWRSGTLAVLKAVDHAFESPFKNLLHAHHCDLEHNNNSLLFECRTPAMHHDIRDSRALPSQQILFHKFRYRWSGPILKTLEQTLQQH